MTQASRRQRQALVAEILRLRTRTLSVGGARRRLLEMGPIQGLH